MSDLHGFDLEERTTEFAKRVVRLCYALPANAINNELIKQVIRSADSIGANYREANDALSKKDKLNRFRITRKEAKESKHHLEIITEANKNLEPRMKNLIQESDELKRIFSKIIEKLENN